MYSKFRSISPQNMTKLQLMADMVSRGRAEFAKKICDSILETIASALAQVILGTYRGQPSHEMVDFAREIKEKASCRQEYK